MTPKKIQDTFWAYFTPDGYIQARSIADTRKLSREMISKFESLTWVDYEKAGYECHKVNVIITPVQKTAQKLRK